jgi:hypothetical protein
MLISAPRVLAPQALAIRNMFCEGMRITYAFTKHIPSHARRSRAAIRPE